MVWGLLVILSVLWIGVEHSWRMGKHGELCEVLRLWCSSQCPGRKEITRVLNTGTVGTLCGQARASDALSAWPEQQEVTVGSGVLEGSKGLSLTRENCSYCVLQARQGETRKCVFQPLCFLPPCSHLLFPLVFLWQSVSPADGWSQSKRRAESGEAPVGPHCPVRLAVLEKRYLACDQHFWEWEYSQRLWLNSDLFSCFWKCNNLSIKALSICQNNACPFVQTKELQLLCKQ